MNDKIIQTTPHFDMKCGTRDWSFMEPFAVYPYDLKIKDVCLDRDSFSKFLKDVGGKNKFVCYDRSNKFNPNPEYGLPSNLVDGVKGYKFTVNQDYKEECPISRQLDITAATCFRLRIEKDNTVKYEFFSFLEKNTLKRLPTKEEIVNKILQLHPTFTPINKNSCDDAKHKGENNEYFKYDPSSANEGINAIQFNDDSYYPGQLKINMVDEPKDIYNAMPFPMFDNNIYILLDRIPRNVEVLLVFSDEYYGYYNGTISSGNTFGASKIFKDPKYNGREAIVVDATPFVSSINNQSLLSLPTKREID